MALWLYGSSRLFQAQTAARCQGWPSTRERRTRWYLEIFGHRDVINLRHKDVTTCTTGRHTGIHWTHGAHRVDPCACASPVSRWTLMGSDPFSAPRWWRAPSCSSPRYLVWTRRNGDTLATRSGSLLSANKLHVAPSLNHSRAISTNLSASVRHIQVF